MNLKVDVNLRIHMAFYCDACVAGGLKISWVQVFYKCCGHGEEMWLAAAQSELKK